MKRIQTVFILLSVVFLISCRSDDESALVNLEPQPQGICANASGITGIYWEFAHSIPPPLTERPLIKNPGGQFIHSQQPLLGFTYPQGFSAFEVTNAGTATVGVNLVRSDNAVVFRWVPNTRAAGQVSATTIIAGEINGMFAHYGFNGTPNVLCSKTENAAFGGIPSQFTARLLRFGDITAQIW